MAKGNKSETSLSGQAVGFFFNVSSNLDETLKANEKSYVKFINSMEKWNTRAARVASSGLKEVTDFMESLDNLPQQVSRSYTKALQGLKREMRPLSQKVNLRFSPDSLKDVKQAVSDAVMNAFSKGSFRMSAAQPVKRSPLFNWHKPLRQMYKHMVQPPDFKMMGMLSKAPKYKEGGVVQPSPMASGTDSVLAWLDPGEIVTPKKELKRLGLHPLSKAAKGLPADVLESASKVETLFAGIERIKKAEVAGVGGAAGIRDMKVAMHQFQVEMKHLQTTVMDGNKRAMLPMVRRMGELRKRFTDIIPDMQKFRREEEDAGLETRSFIHDLRDYGALFAARGVLKDAQSGFHDWVTQAQGVGEEIGVGPEHVKTFAASLFSLNQTLGLSKKDMYGLGQETMKTQDALGLAAAGAEDSFTAMNMLSKAGLKDLAMLKEMAPIVNALAKTTGIDPDSLSKQMYDLTANFQLGVKGSTALEMTFRKLGSADSGFSITADQLSGMVAETENLNRKFADLGGPDVQLRAQQNMAALSSVLSANFLKNFDIRKEMDAALSGDMDAWKDLIKQTGMDAAALVNTLSKPGGAVAVIQSMQQRLAPMMEQLRQADNLPGGARTRSQQLAVIGLQGMGFKVNMADLLQFRRSEEKLMVDTQKATGYFQDQNTAIADLGKNLSDVQPWFDSLSNTIAVKVLKKAVYPLFLAMDHFNWQTTADVLIVLKLTKAMSGLSFVTKVAKTGFSGLSGLLGSSVLATGAIGLAIAGFAALGAGIERAATSDEGFIEALSRNKRAVEEAFGRKDPSADLVLDLQEIQRIEDSMSRKRAELKDTNIPLEERVNDQQDLVAGLKQERDLYKDMQSIFDNPGVKQWMNQSGTTLKDVTGNLDNLRQMIQNAENLMEQMQGGGGTSTAGRPTLNMTPAAALPGFMGGAAGGAARGTGRPLTDQQRANQYWKVHGSKAASSMSPLGPYSSGKETPPLYVRSASGSLYSMSSDGNYFSSDPTATLNNIPYTTMLGYLDNGLFSPSERDRGSYHAFGMSYSDWAKNHGRSLGGPSSPTSSAPITPTAPATSSGNMPGGEFFTHGGDTASKFSAPVSLPDEIALSMGDTVGVYAKNKQGVYLLDHASGKAQSDLPTIISPQDAILGINSGSIVPYTGGSVGATTQPSVSQGTQTVTPTLGTTPLSAGDIGQTINQVAETADPTTHDLLQQLISAVYSLTPGSVRPQTPGGNNTAMPVNPSISGLANGGGYA